MRSMAAACLVLMLGCGNELGECDQEAANQVVYGRGNLVATKGQALMHDSCGQAAFCHSAGASGAARKGVPQGLDFDMIPLSADGLARVLDQRSDIWDQILSGAMPPDGFPLGDGDWAFTLDRKGPRLPSILTKQGKSVVRNWLACGAPVVNETSVPAWAVPPSDGGGTSWTELHANVIVPRCAFSGCHDAGGASLSGDLDLSSACGARAALLKSGPCGEPRVVPGDGDSLLVDKIANAEPRCEQPMPPPKGGLTMLEIETIRAWVKDGAKAPDCP